MKKIQVDPESQRSVEQFEDNHANELKNDHTFEEFKVKNKFKDGHAFEEYKDKREFNDDQDEGRSYSLKTTIPSRSSKTKASSMTTKS